MFNLYIGEMAALFTAFCWTVTSASFEDAGKKIGSFNVNLLRLLFGILFLSIFTLFTRGYFIPSDATLETWSWLMISGLVGIVVGDLLLFEAFVIIGARISMLIYASVPLFSGVLAYFFLGESMTLYQIIGMLITIFGIVLVIIDGGITTKKIKTSHSIWGILLAFGGSIGQATGYVIGKFGISDYNAFAATQIRIYAGIIGFAIIFTIKSYWKKFIFVFKDFKSLKTTIIGSFFGPFLGISFSLYSVQRINPGVASTIMSITPILLIPYTIFIKKEKVYLKEIIGTIIVVIGLGIIFM